jgi:hypothetical protein
MPPPKASWSPPLEDEPIVVEAVQENDFPPVEAIDGNNLKCSTLDPDELQMLFEVHTGRYVTIHDFETNINLADSTTYFDKNMGVTTEFQTISERRLSKFNKTPWDGFWHHKQLANEQLIDACKKGR